MQGGGAVHRDLLAGGVEILDPSRFPPAARELCHRLRDRIERDLLPRSEASAVPVVGLVGPNNAGKSSLFNALAGAGRPVSPAAPTGGFTRVCVGVATPSVLVEARQALSRRFSVTEVEAVDPERVHHAGRAEDLLLVARDSAPADMVVVDAPDFDSVFAGNREAGRALIVTADLLVAVVTPHTYQNRACVDFLADAVRFGKAFVLVYNEAPSRDVAVQHCAKLAADLGHEPLASFWAPHDLAVQSGDRALAPVLLDTRDARDLGQWLRGGVDLTAFSPRAAAASRGALAADLDALAELLDGEMARPRRLHERARQILAPDAEAAARALFPLAPFRDALQQQLDRRSMLHRGLRFLPRQLEEAMLEDTGSVSEDALAGDFRADRADLLVRELREGHARLALPFADFRHDCERSIAAELDERGDEAGLQWMYTALNVLPPVATVTVMVLTGAVGDVGAGVAYLTTQPLLDRAVGREFLRRVHEKWWRARAATLVVLLEETLMPRCRSELVRALDTQEAGRRDLQDWRARLRSAGTLVGDGGGA